MQPSNPSSDPTQLTPPANWYPSARSPSSFDWPTTPSGPADVSLTASISPWDGAVRQALAARSGAPPDPSLRDMAHYDRMLADAKQAHDFATWAFGPPSAPQAPQTRDAVLRSVSLQDSGSTARNVAPLSANARTATVSNSVLSATPSQTPVPAAENKGTTPPGEGRWTPELRRNIVHWTQLRSQPTLATRFREALGRPILRQTK